MEDLEAAVEELSTIDPALLGDGQTLQRLYRLRQRYDAVVAGAAAAFDSSGEWSVDSAHSAAEWLAYFCRLPLNEARRDVRLGREVRTLPTVAGAWRDGAIGTAQVAAMTRVRTPVTATDMERDEEMLVGQAQTLTYRHFTRALAYWEQHADPDGSESTADKQRAGRHVRVSQSLDGRWFGELALDPINGAIVVNELDRLEHELFQDDWKEAVARLGREPTLTELGRTAGQRRADALVEMATRSATAPVDGRRPEPLFQVLVDYPTFERVCELADRTVVTPGSLAPYLDQAWVRRIVFDAKSRVIDVGVDRRCFTGATRIAVEVADRECFHPTCEVPAQDCEIDHIEPYGAGGLTVRDNGRCACGFHNRQRHRRP